MRTNKNFKVETRREGGKYVYFVSFQRRNYRGKFSKATDSKTFLTYEKAVERMNNLENEEMKKENFFTGSVILPELTENFLIGLGENCFEN